MRHHQEVGVVLGGDFRHRWLVTSAHTSPDTAIRVLVVDDHAMVRFGVSGVLNAAAGIAVVGECADGSEVLATARQVRPDVVVMDMSMPTMDGLAATQALRSTMPEPRVVMHTGDGSWVRDEVAVAGAHALVPKGLRPDELLSCVRAVVAGREGCPYCL